MEPRNQQNGINRQNRIDRQPSLIRGGKALLFERLCRDADSTGQGQLPDKAFRAYELQALIDSVLRELRCLLNTRLPAGVRQADESSQTILNYGLPDFSQLNAASPADREALAAVIETKIAAFEPRLRRIRVVLEPDPVNRHSVTGVIQAWAQVASISEPVSFQMLQGNSGVIVQQSEYASG